MFSRAQLDLIKFTTSFLISNLTDEVGCYMQEETGVVPVQQEVELKELLLQTEQELRELYKRRRKGQA